MTEIEQAIYLLREGAENWRYTSQEWIDDKDAEAISLAIEALKEKAEREKGCEYCNKNFQHNYNWLIRDYMLNDKERPRIEITGDGIAVIECDYCPKCGRKLVSKNDIE